MCSDESRSALILVVDDHNDNLRFVGEILDRAGYQVMAALDGQAALARAALRAPDLVLLDMAMPGMDGVEVCRRLRQLPGLSELPVLFVTAAHDRASLTRAFAAGAVDYLTKPFFVDELLARVRNHLELRRARIRLEAVVREREEITDVVAHDLKNPLTCILFAAQAQLRAGMSPRQEALAREIGTSADEALRYIQRFLQRGASAQRLRQFATAPVALAVVADEALRLLRTVAEQREVAIELRGQAVAHADAAALRNVMQNLVSNAIQHAPPRSTITVSLGMRAAMARCEVLDRGPGVSAAIRDRLFQRHVHHPGPDAVYSTGLGLAIARQDIGQMGGHLWYQPRAGGGSVFVFELPGSADAAVTS